MRLSCIAKSRISGVLLCLVLIGCQSASHNTGNEPVFARDQTWILQPLSNQSVSDVASAASTSLLETHLQRRGVRSDASNAVDARYVVQGEVSNWQYEGNTSARPLVSLSVVVQDQNNGDVVWSDSVSSKGGRRESVSVLADRIMAELVNRIPLVDSDVVPSHSVQEMAEASMQATAGTFAPGQAGSLAGALGVRVDTDTESQFYKKVKTEVPLQGRSVAFFYAPNPSVDVLSQFDRLVLEPDNIKSAELKELTAHGARAFAYLSVGEVGPTRAYAKDMDPSWILGKNPAWSSDVLDLTNPELREFLLNRVTALRNEGYQGVFLDTMDSFNLIANTDEERARQTSGLVSLVKSMVDRHPTLGIITNRGFEVLDKIADYVEAVAAESLYASWNNTLQRYTVVSRNDREWLLSKLNHAHDVLNLDVISIDYLPPSRRAEARAVARRIAAHGFIPWVANPALDYIGVGALEVVPRKVMMLYDSEIDGTLERSQVHKFVAMPVEYLGYVPEYLDIAKQPLPDGELKGQYAGIVTWPIKPFKHKKIQAWIKKQLENRVPLVMMGMPPVAFDDAMSELMGIQITGVMDMESAALEYKDELIQPERALSNRIDSMGLVAESTAPENTTHMTYRDKNGNASDVVVTGSFGGFAWQPGLVEDGLDYETYWVIDPFRFMQSALQLPKAPMPDVTTENGRRLWLAHIDGDALPSWAEMPGKQLGAEVIYDRILKRFRLPHTISVVEGEMTELSAVQDRRERMFDTARKIFKLEHVELASHTYSHPFQWGNVAKHKLSGTYNFKIDGYVYSAERETIGSISFIDRELAPPGKQTKVMLWSGDALPGEAALATLERIDMPNLNGGLTSVTRASPTMTLVSPMARPVGKYLQVYAPVMNENLYTHDWLGPFDGFRRAMETFEMTEKPRRLKPINIYYHYYSGTKIASMMALAELYKKTVKQDIYPLYVSDFSVKVPDFRRAGVARYLTGEWKMSRLGNIRSLRLLGDAQWPDLQFSEGISGARKLHDGVYVHTDGSDEVSVLVQPNAPRTVHLVSSNGRVMEWNENGNALAFRVAGEVPVEVELGGALVRGCSLRAGGQRVSGVATKENTMIFSFSTKDTGNAILNCQA